MNDEHEVRPDIVVGREHPEIELAFPKWWNELPDELKPQRRGETHSTDKVSPETKKMLENLRQFATEVIDENKLSLHNTAHSIRRSYWTLYFMYCALFIVGIATAIVAIIKGFTASSATDTYSSLIFAGLSASSFFALFITRPLESLERNSIFSSWLIAVTNTYWTEYAYFDDPGKAYDDLKKATADLTKELSTLADKHAAAIGKYSALTTPDAKTSPSTKPGPDGKPDKPKP